MAGCAVGPKFDEVASAMPTMKAGGGHIYFLRSGLMVGAAIQPDIKLDGEIVGSSKPGSFFYLDRPAGNYLVSTATETEKTASFVLNAEETK